MHHSCKIICLLFLFCIPVFSQSSTSDSIIYPHEVKYSSGFERLKHTRYFSTGEKDYFGLFLATSSEINELDVIKYERDFNNFLEDIRMKTAVDGKPEKKIKFIYKTTHNQYFKKYELQTGFAEIFRNGNFNCVTASALYGIILNKCNITFEVRETPVHVYLIAYPDKEKIKIESTDPAAG